MLAAGALVASLLAVVASPAAAEQENADHKAPTSACVGPADGGVMFDDVSDMHVFSEAIGCVSYYGITQGTGDGSTFSPDDDVTRAQMAVFLARAAGVAGVDLGDVMDAGFGDIGDTWSEAQNAINQLAEKRIIPKGDNYRPGDAMTRAEMAIALVGLLDAAGAIDINDDGTIDLGDDGADDDADDYFADARALSPRAVDRASAALFELGVTNGTGTAAVVDDSKTPLDTNFDPNGTVTRGQMAAFITRALAHTGARPEGVTAQQAGNKVLVSVRDANFAPVANAWVDVFWVNAVDEGEALNANGTCGRLIQGTSDGAFECEIDGADLLTGGNGNAETQEIDVPDGGAVAWAWTGDVGDEFDADDVNKAHVARVELSKAPAPAAGSTTAFISTDLEGTRAKMGSSVTVTLQLQNADGDVTGGAQDAAEPAKWIVTLSTYSGTAATGNAVRVSTVPFASNSDGKGSFVVESLPDPNPNARGQAWTVQYVVTADPSGCTPDDSTPPEGWSTATPTPCSAPTAPTGGTYPTVAPAVTVTDGDDDTPTDSTGTVTFSDASGVASGISIKTSSYVVVAGRAGRTALNRATVTLTDQFGDPVRNAAVTLTSSIGRTDDTTDTDGPSSLAASTGGTPRMFTTGSDGSHTFGYTYSSTAGAVEVITAMHDPTPDDDTGTPVSETATVRWAQEAAGNGATTAVVTGDVDANQIVVLVGSVPVVVTYDDDDRFNTQATNATPSVTSPQPASMADFEKALAAALEPGGSTVNLIWSNYSSRPRNTSVFTLDTNP